MDYFNHVFLKNIDIWGFTMTYIVLYEYFYDNFKTYDSYQTQFLNQIKYIITHFLYENPLIPIDVASLTTELTKLNPLLEKMPIIKKGGIHKTKTKTKTKTKSNKKPTNTNKTRKKR
jgi:hypothetical protein